MPYDEFIGWMAYLEVRPVDWRDDSRTMKLLQVQGCKEKPESIFPSLAAIHKKPERADGEALDLKGSFMLQKIMEAQGGEKIDL